MNILILGNASDAHASHLYSALSQAGVTVAYLDTRLFPTQIQLSWDPGSQAGWVVLPGAKTLRLQDIHSVFWRSFSGVRIPKLEDPYQEQVAFNDAISALRSLMQFSAIHWVNSWQAYQLHKEKPLQLSRVKQLGVRIPATLIANHPEPILEFVKSYPSAIFKPVYGGAHTQRITPEHLEPERLSLALNIAPITVQEYIPGTNIRSYVIADSIYSAEIRSHAIDFREDVAAQLLPVELPEGVQQQCLAIAREFALEWTAIDWRLDPGGEYVFLEANPSPMFLHFEHQTGFPITARLIQLLQS